MSIYTRRTALAAVLAGAAATACDGGASGSGAPLPKSADDLAAQAKKEGEVVIGSGGHTRPHVELLAKEFEAKYGIKVRAIRENSGTIAQRVQAQLTSRSLEFDVVSLNDASTFLLWDDQKVLTDPGVDTAPFVQSLLSKSKNFLPFTWMAFGYAYNSARTKEGSTPKTWAELAERKTKFAVADPSASGAALTFVDAMNSIQPEYFKAFSAQNTLFPPSALALTQLVTTGEAEFALPGIEPDVLTAKASGEPLAMAYPEGKLGALPSSIAALANSPHPAGAKLLMQFQLSPEFQRTQAQKGFRAAHTGLPVPQGIADIPADRVTVVDPAALKKNRETIVKNFNAQVKR